MPALDLPRDRTYKRVQPIGSYGFGNFGDELFVSTVKQQAHLLWPDAAVRTFVPTGPKTPYGSQGIIGKVMRLGAAAAGLLWAETIAVCGGSVLQDIGGISRLRQSALPKKQVEALGISIGPFSSDDASRRVSAFLEQVDRLVVRDPASLRRLANISPETRATLGGDLVALNHTFGPHSNRTSRITVCPSAASKVTSDELASQIFEAAETTLSPRGRSEITLLALSANVHSDDEALCREVSHHLAAMGIRSELRSYSDLGIQGTCDLLATSQMVWSQRLHGAIVAYLCEVPFLLLGHHAKCQDFGEDIGATAQIVPTGASWAPIVEALLDGSEQPDVAPAEYRIRARSAYSPHAS